MRETARTNGRRLRKANCIAKLALAATLAAAGPSLAGVLGLPGATTLAWAEEASAAEQTQQVTVNVNVVGPSEQGFYVPWTESTSGVEVEVSSESTALDAARKTGLTSDGVTFSYNHTGYDLDDNLVHYTVRKGTTSQARWTLLTRADDSQVYTKVSNPSQASLTEGEQLLWYYDDGTPWEGTATVSVMGPETQGAGKLHEYLTTTSQQVSGLTTGWEVLSSACNASNVEITHSSGGQFGEYVSAFTDPSTGNKVKASGKTGGWYWALFVNGKYSNYGLSNFYVRPTDTMRFRYAQTPVTMYRLYNPNSGEHFYTRNVGERSNLVKVGWRYEGIGWYAPTSGDPVYRLYNPNAGEHHYTLDSSERDMLVRHGWRYEGIGWQSDTNKEVPVYREYNPNQFACNHNYTRSESEHKWLVGLGWRDEGIGWYGVSWE